MKPAPQPAPPSLLRWLGPIILIALVIGAFCPVFQADFVDWDDLKTIAQNPALNPATIESIARYWSPANPHMDLYVPVTYTMWGALAMLSPRHGGAGDGVTLSPVLFHAANVLLHAISAVIAFLILRKLVRNEIASLLGAAVFALHPVQTETVAWVSGGKDVLSGALSLLALFLYLHAIEPSQEPRPHGPRPVVWYVFATITFLAAMLAKPQAVIVPLIAGVIDVMLVRRSALAAIRSLALWFVLAIPIVAIGRISQPAPAIDSPAIFRPLVAADALAFYFGKLVMPMQFAVDYGRSPQWLRDAPDRFWTWIVPAAVLIVSVALARRARWLLAGLLVVVAAILPVLGMVPFDFQLHSTVADHYLYVAILGVAMCVAYLMSMANKRWQILFALVPLLLASLTFVQARFWANTRSLFERAQEVNPTSLAASNQLGLYYSAHGEPERAIGCFEVGCRAHPNIAFVHYNYADVLSKNGALAPALQHYQRAVELDPRQADYWANYGLTLAKADHPREALAALGQAVKRNPNHADAYLNAGIVLERVGQIDEARKAFEQVLRLDPTRQAVREHLASLPRSKPPSGSR